MSVAHVPPFVDNDVSVANRISAAWLNALAAQIDTNTSAIATNSGNITTIQNKIINHETGALLKVNGTQNVTQTLLDMLNGANITITDNGNGTVTFAVTGALLPADIGSTVQGYDANTAKINVAQNWSKAQRGPEVTLTSTSNSIAVDLALSNNFYYTTAEDSTLAAPTNAVVGQSGVIFILQGGAAKTLAYNSFWKFPAGTVPSLTASAGAMDLFSYYVHSASMAACTLMNDIK